MIKSASAQIDSEKSLYFLTHINPNYLQAIVTITMTTITSVSTSDKRADMYTGRVGILLVNQGPDLQNILRQSYDYLMIMPKLRSTYDGRLIYKTSYEGRKAFLRYDSLAKL